MCNIRLNMFICQNEIVNVIIGVNIGKCLNGGVSTASPRTDTTRHLSHIKRLMVEVQKSGDLAP